MIEEMKRYEAQPEGRYTAMYETSSWSVKDHYENLCLYLNHAIQIAEQPGRADEAECLKKHETHITTVWNPQFRHAGR